MVLVVAGCLGSILASRAVANSAAASEDHALEDAAVDLAAEVEAVMRGEDHLVATTIGYLLSNPYPTKAEFREWNTRTQLSDFQPEVLSVGAVVIVSGAEVPAFAASTAADRISAENPSGNLVVTPSGERPFHCLASAEMPVDPALALVDGFDLCSIETFRAAIVESRDSGRTSYSPSTVGDSEFISIQSPFYRDGTAPSTVDERRAAFVATVRVVIDPDVFLARALTGRPDLTAAALGYQQDPEIESSIGVPPSGASSVTIDLDNGWEVTSYGSVAATGIRSDTTALVLLLVGLLLSGLLGVFVFVLGAGRDRATLALDRRTGELRHQALHDVLTGLPNRVLIMDRLEQIMARNRRRGTSCAALVIELDDFKNLNGTLGPVAGDLLLVAVARRIENDLRDVDTFGRLGGDEFAILIDGTTAGVGPTLVADRLLKMMRLPFALDDGTEVVQVTASVGIAVGNRKEPSDLLRDAEIALSQAKAAGKNRHQLFDPTERTLAEHRRNLEVDLRSAIQGEQFRLVYQPVYALDDLTMIGFETLLRWQHPTLGLVQPWEFIPILEQNGQIAVVGRWVLQQACTQMATWHALGHPLSVSVNVSGRQLEHSSIVDDVTSALESSGLDPASLMIEVAEMSLMGDVQGTARRLHSLQNLGVKIAIDDFGTGYSSLACLQSFPAADCLKIDRSFVEAIGKSKAANALITTLVQLGQAIGIETLAEGVETTEQMDYLRSQHVDFVQGFLLSKPLDVSTIEATILAPYLPEQPAQQAL